MDRIGPTGNGQAAAEEGALDLSWVGDLRGGTLPLFDFQAMGGGPASRRCTRGGEGRPRSGPQRNAGGISRPSYAHSMSDADLDATTLTPEQAAREVLRIEQRTGSIVQRTVGMTWMIWGFVNGGIFVTYEAIGLAQPSRLWATIGFASAWLPWVVLGSVGTLFLWRTLLDLTLPSSEGGARWVTATAAATFLVLTLGGFAVVTLANLPVPASAWVMFAVGVGAAVVGGSGLTTSARSERRMWLLGGAALAILAVVVDLVAIRSGVDPLSVFLVLGPVASTSLLFGGGLYTASR